MIELKELKQDKKFNKINLNKNNYVNLKVQQVLQEYQFKICGL